METRDVASRSSGTESKPSKNSVETIRAKEERLREKLKRRSSDHKSKQDEGKGSKRRKEGNSEQRDGAGGKYKSSREDGSSSAKLAAASKAPGDDHDHGSKVSNSEANADAKSKGSSNASASPGRSKKNQSRRRRRGRQDRVQDDRGGGNYTNDSYSGGNGRYPENRDFYHGRPRGGEPNRWKSGGYYDHGGAPYGADRGRYGYGGGYNDRDYRDHRGRDRFGRGIPNRQRGRGRSKSRSFSRSRSRSIDSGRSRSYSTTSYSSRSSRRSNSSARYSDSNSRSSRSRSRSSDVSSRRSRSMSTGTSQSRSQSMSRSPSSNRAHGKSSSRRSGKKQRRSGTPERDRIIKRKKDENKYDASTKDQRTLFVSQLVMKADEQDIRRYFYKNLGLKVNDVILLRDKRTGRHKGAAYVELAHVTDVPRALEGSNKVPNFQRFPILIKASEAEKNTVVSNTNVGDKRIETQKVYVGNVDHNITQSQMYAIFSQFGQLDRVLLQIDTATGMSKGYAFLSFNDPKVANLAIQVMSGQVLAGKAIKTGWANQNTAVAGLEEVSTTEFPDDTMARIEKANVVFKQLNGSGLSQTAGILLIPSMANKYLGALALSKDATSAQISVIAEEAVNIAMGLPPSATPSNTPLPVSAPEADDDDNPKHVKGELSRHILVRNMFDKDEETEEKWAEDIKLDFEEEGSKHGKLVSAKVMDKEAGGKIYASFESLEGAASCAASLAGRWFDKRMLKVEFVKTFPN